jgi:uncharacterized membrane protein
MRRFSFRPGLELRGRRFKGLSGLEGKPLHPPLTDVTVGAYFIGPVFELIAFAFRGSDWSTDLFRAGGWVILFGGITSLATAITGFADWRGTVKGSQIRRMANAHAITMIVLTIVVSAHLAYLYLLEGGANSSDPSGVAAILALVVLALVTLGGTLGGSLTYDWGVSVQTAEDHPAYHPGEIDYLSANQAGNDSALPT